MYGSAIFVAIKHLAYKMPVPETVVTVVGMNSTKNFPLDFS